MTKIRIHFDMETQDPDDALTLAILATHPRVDLVGVTTTPGGNRQTGLVAEILRRLDRTDIPIGSADPARTRDCVSSFHYKWLGEVPDFEGKAAEEVLEGSISGGPTTLLTGGPPRNPGRYYLRHVAQPFFTRWVAQGGFAGDSVVPPEHRLAKFAGKETCATFNLNGDIEAALALQTKPHLERIFVSKNVCHGVSWDQAFHARVASCTRSAGLQLAYEAMTLYLRQKPQGKLLHDPLAMAVAIDPTVVQLAPVHLYRHKGEWGAKLWTLPGPAPERISVAVDRERFFEVLTAS